MKINSTKQLEDWISRIEAFNPNEIELGLERVQKVANSLGLTKLNAKIIMIGGTNGKGSCVATLESLAAQSQLKVASYTSPHLRRFNERIKIDGQEVTDDLLVEHFKIIENSRQEIPLTFFEFTTLVALSIFSQQSLDLVILEIGLGGRLDAVNIVEPDVTIITTIDKDHESWLGVDKVSIAYEKSGICRTGKKNLIGDKTSYNLVLKARAKLEGVVSLVKEEALNPFSLEELNQSIDEPQTNCYQLLTQNILISFAAFNTLFAKSYECLDITEVVKNIRIEGRFQSVLNEPLTIVDVGHNTQAANNLKLQCSRVKSINKRIAICGMMADKAIVDVIGIMDDVIDCWYFVDLPIERAASASDLLDAHSSLKLDSLSFKSPSVSQAFQEIRGNSSKDDLVLVFGSFITVAEMLQYCDNNSQSL